ncbi:MAG: GNAT family N-acetyltransferase [Firmicutes bacterium]|nr:GNAT family N-acetyltransferase [Bacillota bacterium]
MNNSDITIRVASTDDASALLAIYAPYVEATAITFEYIVPSVEEFTRRIRTTLEKYPYLVAEHRDGRLLGYAYASPFKARAAYDWAVETTIYLAPEAKCCGLGRRLYEALEQALKAQNILNLNACISEPEVEDEYLTKQSHRFHEHMGYRLVGEFHLCGYKFNRWYHMIWMEKHIGEHTADQPAVIPFPQLTETRNCD